MTDDEYHEVLAEFGYEACNPESCVYGAWTASASLMAEEEPGAYLRRCFVHVKARGDSLCEARTAVIEKVREREALR